ncbi:MAG: M23 family metallopeptidase [bacterium]
MAKLTRLKNRKLVIIEPKGNVRNIHLSGFKYYSLIFFIGLAVLSVIYSCNFIIQYGSYSVLSAAEYKESGNIRKTVLGFKEEIKSINNQILVLFKDDDNIRTMLGSPELSSEIRQMGTGGPMSKIDEKMMFTDPVMKTADSCVETLNKISRQYQLQSASFAQLKDQLNLKLNNLSRIPSIWPASGDILSHFGMRLHPVHNVLRLHTGVDIVNKSWTPIYATAGGRVTVPPYSKSYGNYIYINHFNNYSTVYAHLIEFNVSDGQIVKRGDLIGYMGETGVTTGPHLHYEVRLKNSPVNPLAFMLPVGYSLD